MARPSTDKATSPDAAPSLFEPEGALKLDAFHFARAVGAVRVACADEPILQLEIFDNEGVLVVGTDKESLLRAWVPMPDPDGWKVTAEVAGLAPKLDEKPTRVVSAAIRPTGLRLLADLAKAKRAKDNPQEHITIEWGLRREGEQPSLGGDVRARAVRFVTDDDTHIASDPQDPFDWRPGAREIEDAEAAVLDWGMRISAGWARVFSGIADALGDDDRCLLISPAMVGTQRFSRVSVPGFPPVRGYGMER